jgi:enoyl-CoA hydratase
MGHVTIQRTDGVVSLGLERGKVNALDRALVHELAEQVHALARDGDARALVLTGTGKFFSFGFDIPALYPLPRDEFAVFVADFAALYRTIFLYPKPVVAALNGHAIAGGCMLALACDCRLMVGGTGAKIALNEIGFGSSVFAGATAMLRACVGDAAAARVVYSGALYPADEARGLGLVDEVVDAAALAARAGAVANELAAMHAPAFASIKRLLREPIAAQFDPREAASIAEFVDIWYSDHTRAKLREIEIRR